MLVKQPITGPNLASESFTNKNHWLVSNFHWVIAVLTIIPVFVSSMCSLIFTLPLFLSYQLQGQSLNTNPISHILLTRRLGCFYWINANVYTISKTNTMFSPELLVADTLIFAMGLLTFRCSHHWLIELPFSNGFT